MQVDVNTNHTEHYSVSICIGEQKYRGDAEVKQAPNRVQKVDQRAHLPKCQHSF